MKKAKKRSEHVHVAVGEIDQPQDAVHHGVAQGDQRVDAPEVRPLTSCCRNSVTSAARPV